VPEPLNVKFALVTLENGIEFPALPQTTAVTTTFEPLPLAVTCDGMAALIAGALLVIAAVAVERNIAWQSPRLVVA
jgi:hypothetical protein